MPEQLIDYALTHFKTAAAAGYFACIPERDPGFDGALAYLREHPTDEFMHRALLGRLLKQGPERLEKQLKTAGGNDPVLSALLWEACRVDPKFSSLIDDARRPAAPEVCAATPLIDLRSDRLDDQVLHRRWARIFRDNMFAHQPLPAPDRSGLPALFSDSCTETSIPDPVPIDRIAPPPAGIEPNPGQEALSPEETAARALERLEAAGILAEREMRHTASLSPVALLRKWAVDFSVRCGCLDYRVSGFQTSYGRGFSLETARVRYAMEIVERCASFAGVNNDHMVGTLRVLPLVRGSFSVLRNSDPPPLDPNRIALEVPYRDAPLYWVEGSRSNGKKETPVRVPCQCVFLFSNLDEICLFSGLGSTGLAAGNTVEEARRSALLELIERDCEATTIYEPSLCFRITADDPFISALLADYRQRGVSVQFQDLTGDLGIPCYKCYVIDPAGAIVKGTGAHLDGRYALLAALTETPYPYPDGPPSRPGPDTLPTVQFESVPNYSTGHPATDLKRIETLLAANGYEPIYVDLTRKDIRIPVVRALIPGLEIMADFDDVARVSRRLYRKYLRRFR